MASSKLTDPGKRLKQHVGLMDCFFKVWRHN
jgi:hypothetical protein